MGKTSSTKAKNLVGFARLSEDELDSIEKAMSVLEKNSDGYGKITRSSFCRKAIMDATNKILKKGK